VGVEIEARAYGPESSPEEIAAIRDRVSLFADGILRFREVPVPTPFAIDVAFDRIHELVASMERYHLLLDLTEASRPSAAVRAHLRTRFSDLPRPPIHVGVFTGANFMLNMAAKFVLTSCVPALSVHKTEAQALHAIRSAMT